MNSPIIQKLDHFRVDNKSIVSKERVTSVDALRGFDMFWIIGGEFIFKSLDNVFHNSITQFISNQLDHVEWFGFRFYDIIMPLFLFLVGISMVYSSRKRLQVNPSKNQLWRHIIKRAIILWILGMGVQGNLLSYDINQIKFYSNTLQAIASGYLIASLLILHFSVFKQIIGTATLMIIYCILLSFVPVPGSGAGIITPEGNLAIWFDKFVFGSFQDGTTYSWLISSLNFGATTMLGVFAGYILQSDKKQIQKFYMMAIAGIGYILLAKIWDIWHPIVKHIWTSSFVLFSGGICILMLAVFYYIVDYLNYKKWSLWLIIIGSNAIVAYCTAHLFDCGLIADVFVKGLMKFTGDWFPFIRTTGGFIALFLVLRYMYRNKIFVKV